MTREDEINRLKAIEQTKKDIIGTLFTDFEISDMLHKDFGNTLEGQEQEALYSCIDAKISEYVEDSDIAYELTNDVITYGSQSELLGFREGFSLAIRIMTQGLSGNSTL